MDRRGVLKSVMSTVGSAGLIAAGGGAWPRKNRRVACRRRKAARWHSRLTRWRWVVLQRLGDGQPLVLFAPWGIDSDWWEYQMAYLVGQGLRCIGYDRRGHGRSVEPSGGYDYDTLADDLNDVIEQLDLHGVAFVGHSIGSARWSVICRGMVLAASLGWLWLLPIRLWL